MERSAKRITMIVGAACLALVLAACGQTQSDNADGAASSAIAPETSSGQAASEFEQGIHHAVVEVEGYPAFTIEMNADAAPATVSNFCSLAQQGYYDGLAFYRIADGFVIQGGTKGNTASGSDSSIPSIVGEFSANGIDNPLADAFDRGTVAMARMPQDPDSASSTFFITLGDAALVGPSLNGQYAAFGMVSEDDMATIDQIVADFAQYSDSDMGMISDEAHMPMIASIAIAD